MKKKFFALALAAVMTVASTVTAFGATQVYFEDFEDGAQGDYTVVGTGKFDATGDEFYGTVYHNGKAESGTRNNYLVLPSDIFAKVKDTAGVDGVTIGFWAKTADDSADWYWTPHFSAYGAEPGAPAADSTTGADKANTWPMLVIQKRQVLQVNCAGWCDFTDAQNDAGTNAVGTAYSDDNEWHYITVTMTATKATYYVDGVVANSWTVDNSANVITGPWLAGNELDYVCLGGNQAWDFNDKDVAMLYDDVAVYAGALTQAEIQKIITDKTTPATVTPPAGGNGGNGNSGNSTDTADMAPVVAVVALAAVAAVVALKKRTVNE